MDIQKIEELALNAWPGLQTYVYSGWMIRLAEGYTKRANSVTPLYTGDEALGLAERVMRCEQVYGSLQRPQPTIFRIPSFVRDVLPLDGFLAKRGYTRLDETLVMGLDLSERSFEPSERVTVMSGPDGLSGWLAEYERLSQSEMGAPHEKILQQILGQRCPMVLTAEDEIVACGLGVADADHIGLFDVVTAVEQRRQGYGRELVQGLLGWGMGEGMRYGYLQVVAENEAAVGLYQSLGFQELYRYWYRVEDREGK